MERFKGTPAPWNLTTVPFEIRNTDSAAAVYGPVSLQNGACLIADISRSPGDEVATANAQLIAAAPELLEQCISLESILAQMEYEGVIARYSGMGKLKAAITKATSSI